MIGVKMILRVLLLAMIAVVLSSCSSDTVVIKTNYGTIEIELDKKNAPKHAENFKKLVKEQFLVGTTFHRVVPGYLIQGGDPLSRDDDRLNDGTGGPDYTIEAEINLKHEKGAVAAARRGDNVNPEKSSNGSQFYICLRPLPMLDGNYTVFGKVVKGMEVAEKISRVKADQRENPERRVVMENVYIK